MTYFLIHYDRPAGRLLSIREYSEAEATQADADLREQESAKPAHVEVVMLHARSIDDLKRTHGRYFKTAREIAGID